MRLPFELFRWVSMSVLVGACFVTTYTVASAPSRIASRLGLRGLKRQRAIASGGPWSVLEPLVRWLGVRVSGVMGDKLYDSLDRQLTLAGDYLGLTAPEYAALSLVGGAVGLFLGFGLARLTHLGPIVMGAAVLLGFTSAHITIAGEAETRLKRISRGLPYAIDLMALGMTAGLDFPGSVRQVVEKSSDPYDPLTEELGFALQKLSLGQTRRQVLLELADRAPVEVVLEFVGAVVQAEERGHPVARVLRIQATTSRERRSVRAEEKAAKAGVA
ncbi:MAG TPA: type II secretion system F family protein, partial [Polyangiaceae bacterium]